MASAFIAPILAFVVFSASAADEAAAHPLGNFTVNRYSRIELYSDAVRVRYVLDLAEIPAFEEIDAIDTDGDGEQSQSESARYLAQETPRIVDNLTLRIDGREQELDVVTEAVTYPEGQGGLDTLRISLLLEARPATSGSLEYTDDNYSDRIGWKEIVLKPAEGVFVSETSVPSNDVSAELTAYPDDLLSSPLNVTSAAFTFDASNGAPAPAVSSSATTPAADRMSGNTSAGFAGLIDSENLTLTVVLLSLLAALGFGAVHALEPGHGKTFVAAYFVGVKGTAREAVLLGLIVAATHTIGVFVIGLITLFGSQFILPEDLYSWLSFASGLMVLLLGIRLLAMRSRGVSFLRRFGRRTHEHAHDHPHDHEHAPPPGVSPWKGLIALGLADGLTPSPSALIVLLAAVSLDRIGLGVLLIVAFSVGLAAVLTLVCLSLVYLRRILDWATMRGHRIATHPVLAWATGNGGGQGALTTVVPVFGAVVLTAVGLLLTIRALPNL
jgi:ABC-type nickel/cobalt efflux system permease component RcnA